MVAAERQPSDVPTVRTVLAGRDQPHSRDRIAARYASRPAHCVLRILVAGARKPAAQAFCKRLYLGTECADCQVHCLRCSRGVAGARGNRETLQRVQRWTAHAVYLVAVVLQLIAWHSSQVGKMLAITVQILSLSFAPLKWRGVRTSISTAVCGSNRGLSRIRYLHGRWPVLRMANGAIWLLPGPTREGQNASFAQPRKPFKRGVFTAICPIALSPFR